MAKRKLTIERQLRIVKGNLTKEFHIKAYQGFMKVRTKREGRAHMVEIKAYNIYVSERWSRDGQIVYSDNYDTGFVSSRANEIASLVRLFLECNSIPDMNMVLEPLRKQFKVAIKKDAQRTLLKQLGYIKPAATPVSSTKEAKPLPQIILPWDSEQA